MRVSLVIASHLADAQIEMMSENVETRTRARQRVQMVRILLHRYPNTKADVGMADLIELWESMGVKTKTPAL